MKTLTPALSRSTGRGRSRLNGRCRINSAKLAFAEVYFGCLGTV
jgi:hypothetical protein